MTQFNRRTVVRGAAWSLPIVAVAAQAPAFASSTAAPRPMGVEGCRLTAGGNSNCYKFVLTFARPTDSWKITLQSVFLVNTSTSGGEEVVETTTPKNFIVSSSPTATNVFELVACTTGTMQNAVKVRFVYEGQLVSNASVRESVTLTYDLETSPCKVKT